MSVRSYEQALILAGMTRTRSAGLRDHLVAAADELLDQAGPGTLTTRQIAHHAAVSDGVLYNHFRDKDELLIAALVRRYTRLVERFEGRLVEGSAAEKGSGALAGWLQAYTRALRDLDADALHLAAGLLAAPELLQRFWLEIHRLPLGLERLQGPLLERLAAGTAVGQLRAGADPRAAMTALFGLAAMHALTLRLNPGAEQASNDRQLEAGVDLIWEGLRARA